MRQRHVQLRSGTGRPSGPSTRPRKGTLPGVSSEFAPGCGTAVSAVRREGGFGLAAGFCEGSSLSEPGRPMPPRRSGRQPGDVAEANVSFWSNMILKHLLSQLPWPPPRRPRRSSRDSRWPALPERSLRPMPPAPAARASRRNTAPSIPPSWARPRRISRALSRSRPSLSRRCKVRSLNRNSPAARA